MAENLASVADEPEQPRAAKPLYRRWWFYIGCAAVLGVVVGLVAGLISRSSSSSPVAVANPDGAAAHWAAGAKAAPGFTLRDQNGAPVSLASLYGRRVIVTFIDPLCRDFCPLEAKVLNQVAAKLPAAQRPVVVAVSVNEWGNARSNLLLDVRKWHLTPTWRWAVGSPVQLAKVWKDYYVGVQSTSKTIAGVTVHQITHTEAAYLIDRTGHQRALFMWPFGAHGVELALEGLSAESPS